MESRAKLFGHPIHQMLVAFPLGLLATALAFDVIHLITANGYWSELAFWMIAAGVITGLLAAPFGFIDWLAIPSDTRAKRIGALHGIGNVIVVLLYAASWLMRSTSRPSQARPLTCSHSPAAASHSSRAGSAVSSSIGFPSALMTARTSMRRAR